MPQTTMDAQKAQICESHVLKRYHVHSAWRRVLSSFRPDAALVNLYHVGDTLRGHKDDVENDATWPLVSISLGCPAVFLVGGSSLDQAPLPLLLRPRTVVVLAGSSRLAYHGA